VVVAAPSAAQPLRIPSAVFVEVVRLLTVVLCTAAGWQLAGGNGASARSALLGAVLGACVGYLQGGLVGRALRRALSRFEERVERTSAASLVLGAVLAALFGLLGAVVGSVAVALLPGSLGWPILAIMTWLGVFAGFSSGSRKGEELLRSLRQRRGVGLEEVELGEGSLVLVDSSVAIDGRLLAVTATGFLAGRLAVPRFVLDELQGVADAADATRRRRGRRGLEALAAIQAESAADVVVLEDEVPEHEDVDAKLVALAVRNSAALLTVDDGLARVAELRGVRCLNLNRLAVAVQPVLVPGEVIRLRVSREGRDTGQGVGFLDDGTMVVVSDGAELIGQDADVSITSSVQTSRGRMFFASLAA
jgi:uncharacterized protein YacL